MPISPKELYLLSRLAKEVKLESLIVIGACCLLGCGNDSVGHRQTTAKRVVAAIEEAGRYLDCSRGRTEFFLTSTPNRARILIDLATEQEGGGTVRLLALVERDGKLEIFGRSAYIRTSLTTLKPLAKVYELMADQDSDRVKVEFSAVMTQEPRESFVSISSYPLVPDAATHFVVTGEQVRRLRR